MSYNKQKQISTIKFENFEPTNLTFDPWLENDKSKTQPQAISFHKYKTPVGDKLRLQLPWIKMYQYGVPRLCDWVKSDRDRSKVKIPLDINSKEIALAVSKLQELDTIMSSDEMKKKLFPGKKPEKYLYISTVKTPQSKDEDDDNVVKSDLPLSMTLKLKIDRESFPEIVIQTEVYDSIVDSDGKRTRIKQNVSTVDEFAQKLSYQSTFRAIIEPVKLWSDKKAKPGIDKLQYGVMWQLYMVEIEPSENKNKNANSNVDFVDDDDTEDPIKEKSTLSTTQTSTLLNQLTQKNSNTLDDIETPNKLIPNKTTKTIPSKSVPSKDEDEDDEEDEKIPTKNIVNEDSDSEEELEPEPEPEPPKKSKKTQEAPKSKKK